MPVFEQFKKKPNSITSDRPKFKKLQEVSFVLQFDDQGAYIEVCDEAGATIEVDYRQYSGTLRNILKTVDQINEKSDFGIDWENPEKKIYLHEHPYLISQMLHSGKLIDKNKQPINGDSRLGRLTVHIALTDNGLMASSTLQGEGLHEDEFVFLNENHALLPNSNTIVETAAIGANFNQTATFNSSFRTEDLQKYLSILFSYIDNVDLVYSDYTLNLSGDKISTQPVLIFEKVDEDNALFLRVSQRLPDTGADFLDDYELQNFASVNDMERTISVREVDSPPTSFFVADIEKRLEKYAGKSTKKKLSGVVLEDDLFIIPDEIAASFIYKEIPDLLSQYAIAGAEKLKKYKINTTPPRLNINMSSGIDFLEGEANLQFGDEKISLFDALNQYNKNRYILLSNGDHTLVNEAYMQKLQRLFKKKKDNVQISFFDLPLVDELIEEKTVNTQFEKSRAIFEGFNKLESQEIVLPNVKAMLRDYQVKGYKWLLYLHEKNLGGCLADDMGLGKTLQTITLLAQVYQTRPDMKPSLIVMPRSLLFNWDKEVRRFAPQLSTYTYYGNTRDQDEAIKSHLIFTTYALMRNDIEDWKEKEFLYVILDESQNIKNMQTQASKAVMLLNADHRLALSGTPIENSLAELYSLFRFLNPSMFGSAESFNQQYLLPIQKHNDKTATADLRRKVYPFILRRLKKDVLKELPDKIEQTLYVEMSDEQTKYYEQRRQFYKQAIEQQVAMKGIQQAQFFIFQAMNELRQIATIPEAQTNGRIASPKVELLVEQLLDAVANRHKVLVFCNFLHAIELISEKLNEQSIDFVTMTGSTRNRQELVERFQNNGNCKVFLMTLKTGGTGLNLTAADIVFIFDPWWNKAAENQAIDRAHRIGQENKVLSYRLISTGSIEEKIVMLQDQKSELFQNIISDDTASLKNLSQEDINFILAK